MAALAVSPETEDTFPLAPRQARSARRAAWVRSYRLMLIGVDSLAVVAAVALAFHSWISADASLSLSGFTQIPYLALAPVVYLIWMAALGVLDTRDPQISGAGLEEYRKVLKASLYVFGLLAILSYVFKAQLPRSIFVTLLPAGVVFLLFGRWVTRSCTNSLRRHHNKFLTSTLIVGNVRQVERLVCDLSKHTDAGYRPDAICVLDAASVSLPDSLRDITMYGPEQLGRVAAAGHYEAVIASEGMGGQRMKQLAWQLEGTPTELLLTPRMVDVAGPRIHVRDAEGVSLLHVDLPRFAGWKHAAKRAFDILFSVIALILLSPVFLVIAILIKHEDGGPVIFRQERIGQDGHPFTIHKFRSMCLDAEAKIDDLINQSGGQATFFKLKDDPRVTRVGRVLRKYSLDELPQFWSVLKGPMSVVGPRPQVAREVAEYSRFHHRRLLTKPGITGLWQVSGRSDLSVEEGMRLDLRYVENWSLIGDIVIVLKTIVMMLHPHGAY